MAFWKIDAVDKISFLLFKGGPRGGNSGCCSVGVTAFETDVELLPERRPEDELEPELRDLLRCGIVFVLLTIRLEGRELWTWLVAVALVKVNVKYCVSSMLQMEIIHDAWMAFEYEVFLSGLCRDPPEPRASGAMTTSTETS